jgi:hypothetical protein
MHKWAQRYSDAALLGAQRRIVVNGEDANTGRTTIVHDGRFPWQRAVSVDAPVDAFGEVIAVLKKSGGLVVNRNVGECTPTKAGLDEWWVNAAVVGKRCNERSVDAVSFTDIVRVENNQDEIIGELRYLLDTISNR